MADSNYAQHQMGTPVWLVVKYWVEGSREEQHHNVLMVGSCNKWGSPEDIEALVLSDSGRLHPISFYMKGIEATMFKVIGVAQPKEQGTR